MRRSPDHLPRLALRAGAARAVVAHALLLACLAAKASGASPGIDLRHTSFSRRGSWMTLCLGDRPATLRFFFSRLLEEKGHCLDLGFRVNGVPRPTAVTAEPEQVLLHTGGATAPRARAYVTGPRELAIETWGMDLVLTSVKEGLELREGAASGRRRRAEVDGWTLEVAAHEGSVADEAGTWHLTPVDGRLRAVLRMSRGNEPPVREVDGAAELSRIRADWEAFRAMLPAVPESRRAQAEAAWWNLWSLHAPAEPPYATEAVLAGKADMNAVWPWDHCFPALALGRTDLSAGLAQWLIPFLQADEHGQLPDELAPDLTYRGVTKPPIHGWALGKLMDWHRFTKAQLEAVTPRLAAWTEFWFARRDADGNGIPEYGGEHAGWESGWDNATGLPDPRGCYESPDLSAYLVLQMRTLARLSRALGRQADAARWDERATRLLRRVTTELFDGRRFVIRTVGSVVPERDPTSLLNLMPLVLGNELDPAVFRTLADELEQRFLTPWGPATEDPASPHYRPDGYWRGPVWAPTTYLLADGLRRGGRADLAREIARRFCDLVAHAGGHYENYDSLAGTGRRCKGFAWTSAVDVLLMHEHLRQRGPGTCFGASFLARTRARTVGLLPDRSTLARRRALEIWCFQGLRSSGRGRRQSDGP